MVEQNFEKLQFVCGVKVLKQTPARPVEELWVMTNRFPGHWIGSLNIKDKNYRILKGSVKDIIKENPVCDVPKDKKLLIGKQVKQ